MESEIKDLRQQLFDFKFNKSLKSNDFFISDSNFYAYNLLLSWPKWEKKILNIYGERKSGKSHLSEIFLENEKGIKFKFKELNDKIFDKIKVVKPVSVKKSDIPSNTLKLIEEAEKVIKSKMQSG